MDLSGKRLLVLGGNPWVGAIKQFAETEGITIVAAGNNPDSEIFRIAAERYPINSTDIEGMKQLIAAKQIDGVYLGASEPVIAAACEYVNDAGLPCYCTKTQWNALQNKVAFKELCSRVGLPTVRSFEIDELTDADCPVVVKPVDGCGSRGMSVCRNREETLCGCETAKQFSPSGKAIVEKYVNNSGFCALYTVCNGETVFAALEAKYPVHYEKHGSYVGGIYLSQSEHTDEFRELFDVKITEMIRTLGIRSGSIWMEVFYDSGSYYFNEAGFRYGGELSMFPTQYFSGINQVAADMYYALTGESKTDGFAPIFSKEKSGKHYCVYPLHAKAGQITAITGTDTISSMPNVIGFFPKYEPGDRIRDTGSFGQIFALCHFTFDEWQECIDMIEKIHSEIRVESEDGNLLNRMLNIDAIAFPF